MIVYTDEYTKLINGDSVSMIDKYLKEGKKFDLILTDPPYGIKYESRRRTEKYERISGDNDLSLLNFIIDISPKLIKDTGCAIIFYSQKNPPAFKPFIKDVLIWVKNNWTSGDLKSRFGNRYEPMFFIPGPNFRFPGRRPNNVFHAKKEPTDYHPTQKPIALLEQIISVVTKEGDIVFDPFVGSGSTLIAAKNLRRKSIGIEIDNNYCAVAEKRLKEHERMVRGILT